MKCFFHKKHGGFWRNTASDTGLQKKGSPFVVACPDGVLNLWLLAFPMMLEMILPNFISSVCTGIISNYSEHLVNAVSVSTTVINMLYILSTVIATGSTVVISKYIGGGEETAVRETVFSALTLCGILGILCSILLTMLASPIMGLMNLSGPTYEMGLSYFRFLSASYFLYVLNSVVLALLRCFGRPGYSVAICVLGGLVNLGLTAWFLLLPESAPVTGVQGICVASGSSILLQLLLSALCMKKAGIKLRCPGKKGRFAKHTGDMLRIGIPSAISACSLSISGVVTTSFVARFGDAALAARTYINTVVVYTYIFSASVGNAGALLTGRMHGAGNYGGIARLNRAMVWLTVPVNTIIAFGLTVFSRQIMGLFTDNPVIWNMAFLPLALNIVIALARSVSHVYEYSLRATGDVMVMMIATLFSCWICGVGVSYLTAVVWNWGLLGYYFGLMLDEVVRTVFSLIRWRAKGWSAKQKPTLQEAANNES